MSIILAGVLIIAALTALAVFGTALARSSAKSYAAQNELIPGVDSKAPSSWAGAHTPEAKMHRRLVKAIASVRITGEVIETGSSTSDARLLQMRVELEQQATQVDNQLIAAAAAPEGPARDERLAQLEQSVRAIETAAGDLGQLIAGSADTTFDAVADVADQIRIAGEVQRELEALEGHPPPSDLSAAADADVDADADAGEDEDPEQFGTPGTA